MSDSPDQSSDQTHKFGSVQLGEIFAPSRILTLEKVASHKRLMDSMAAIFAEATPYEIDKNQVFRALLHREDLGSTWMTDDLMFPHIRLSCVEHVIGVIVRLDTTLCVDEDENKCVRVACGVLSPDTKEGRDEHALIVKKMAYAFEVYGLLERLMEADDSNEMFEELMIIERKIDATVK